MAEDRVIDLEEDKEIFRLGLKAIRSPKKTFQREIELPLSLQFLFLISVMTGIIFTLASALKIGIRPPVLLQLTVKISLSIFQFLIIIPVFVILETSLFYLPMKAVFDTDFKEVLSVISVSSVMLPFIVFSALLPRPLPAIAMLPGIYMLYIQFRGLMEIT